MIFRTRHLRISALLALLAALLWPAAAPMNAAQPVGIGATFDIVPDGAVLANLPAIGTTFYLQGKVYHFRAVNQASCQLKDPNEPQLGTWRAWGEVADEGRLVIHHSVVLDTFNASLEAQGVTGISLANEPALPAVSGTTGAPFTGPSETLALTGGAGTFRGIVGEVQIRPYCQGQADTSRSFRYDRAFRFGVVEAKRK